MATKKPITKIELFKKRRAPEALDPAALYEKSRAFAQRVIDSQESNDEVGAQLWAASALELLGKTALATLHPSLVIDIRATGSSNNPNLLLEASGVSTSTAVKTIDAATTYARLKHVVHLFNTPIHDFSRELANRRNAEIHSGVSVCAQVPEDEWAPRFWLACELILHSLDHDLQKWIGTSGKDAKKRIETWKRLKIQAAKALLKERRAAFKTQIQWLQTKKGAPPEPDIELVANPKLSEYHEHFVFPFDKYWHQECPACKSQGIAAGDLAYEDATSEPEWDMESNTSSQWFERTYYPEEFYCPSCRLSLLETFALEAVGINDSYVVEIEQVVDYDMEYGND
jgi:hypothetical protein